MELTTTIPTYIHAPGCVHGSLSGPPCRQLWEGFSGWVAGWPPFVTGHCSLAWLPLLVLIFFSFHLFSKKALRNINQSKHETEVTWHMCSNVIRMITRLKLIKLSAKCQQKQVCNFQMKIEMTGKILLQLGENYCKCNNSMSPSWEEKRNVKNDGKEKIMLR